jgi:hypothetical protein
MEVIDEVEVARYMAWQDTAETPAERRRKADLKGQKEALVDALHLKCRCSAVHL